MYSYCKLIKVTSLPKLDLNNTSFPFQLKTCEIDGLNMEDTIFNYKNKLLFAHSKDADENITNAFVVLDRPLSLPHGGANWLPENMPHTTDNVEALNLVGVFLACFHLVNDKSMPIIAFDSPNGFSLRTPEEAIEHAKMGGGYRSEIKSRQVKMAVKETCGSLEKTVPLFEKVYNIMEKNKKKANRLVIALLVYHRAMQNKGVLQDFIDLVTIIEALLCDKEDLTYKFALRTTILVETDRSKMRKLFENLKQIYSARSKLVHGSDMTLFPYADYLKHKDFLVPIVKVMIQKYIELQSSGVDSVMEYVDNLALGQKDFVDLSKGVKLDH